MSSLVILFKIVFARKSRADNTYFAVFPPNHTVGRFPYPLKR